MKKEDRKEDLKNLSREEMNQRLRDNGFKEYHSTAIFKSLYCRREKRVAGIGTLSSGLRRFLEEKYDVSRLDAGTVTSSQDGSLKFLFYLSGGEPLECVYIPEPKRKTLCLSSQVGCKYGCSFCVSGKDGFGRNLTTAEMVNQVLMVNDFLENSGGNDTGTVSNVVFMGSGEPLDNYDNVIRAISILRDNKGLYLARRKVSMSTCGIIPGIQRLIRENRGIPLSVSLHATDDETRSQLMPVNKKYPLKHLKQCLREYCEAEKMPVFLEYVMIRGVNDSVENARALSQYVKDIDCKVNLIPCNPSPYYRWQPPGPEEIDTFRSVLEADGVFYWIRKSRGRDISAACGLLPALMKRQ
jgi:23S rRNA (adenine2503-C2)-methyltransferase